MTKHLHLIYIPGLGDHQVGGQQFLIKTWQLWGVSAELFRTGWADGEEWEPKLNRLLERIDAAKANGQAVGLVGASAGATAVINALHARQDTVVGAVLIAGKVNRPHTISKTLRKKNTAFGSSADKAFIALNNIPQNKRKHIQSRYASSDNVVSAIDSIVPGAQNLKVFTSGHAFTIATQLLFGAPSFIRFLKKQA